MGAKIQGAGTSTIKIEGVDYLHKCFHEVIPDRIEAGTYIMIGALCGKALKVDNVIPEHVDALISKLEELGINLEVGLDYVTVLNRPKVLKATNVKTAVYPGFATDLQQPFTVLLTQAEGKSKVTETIFENRFMHIPYLRSLGADITIKNQTATVEGPTKLKATLILIGESFTLLIEYNKLKCAPAERPDKDIYNLFTSKPNKCNLVLILKIQASISSKILYILDFLLFSDNKV